MVKFGKRAGAVGVLLAMWIGFHTGGAAMPDQSPPWMFRALLTEDGLPDNCVTGIAQTRDGYLWVATRGGLMRFNGVEFVAMPLPPLPGVLNRVVRAMFLDARERMWLEMDRGPLVSLGREGARSFGPPDGLPGSLSTSMAVDRHGALWQGYNNRICRILDGTIEEFIEGDGLSRNGGNTRVTSDNHGEIWFSQGNHVGVFRDGRFQKMLTLEGSPIRICKSATEGIWICAGSRLLHYVEGGVPREVGNLPEKSEARVLMEDRSGALWIGTAANGLLRLMDGILEKVPTSHEEVDCLIEDREGHIWAGTNGGGLNQILPRALALYRRDAGLPSESVRSVCEDSEGRLWVTTQNGIPARLGEAGWEEVGKDAGWTGGIATCVAADRDGAVWIGTRHQGLHQLHEGRWRKWSRAEGLASISVRSIHAAANGDIWIATDSPRKIQLMREGKLITMKSPTDLRPIRAAAEGPDGTMWFGTSEGQILKVSDNSIVDVTGSTGMPVRPIRCLHSTLDGALWIGFAGYGVGRLKDGKYGQITTKEGLMDDYASQIFSDDRGAMWIAGNFGLFQVGLGELTDVAEGRSQRVRSRIFGKSHGLVGLQPSFEGFPSVCRSRDGRLWFAMRSGLLMVQPEKILDNTEPPPVILEAVAVDDQTVARYDNHLSLQKPEEDLSGMALRLKPDHRKVEFSFAAMSFGSPENVHFRYQLVDFDKKWIEAGSDHRAIYPHLPAGNYSFRVIACNNAGVWNESGATLAFAVAPSFWQTWWFRGLGLGLFTTALISIVRYLSFRRLRAKMRHLEQQAALHNERARIARDMHDEVGAKLTRLSLLSDMAGGQPDLPPDLHADVSEISDTARETILAFEEIVWAVNPHNDTLGDLVHYLCRHAEEFFDGSPTHCMINLPKSIPQVTLPTETRHQVFLASKEALTNVMKHARASQVNISLTLLPDAFEIVIHDNGCGFDQASPGQRAGGGNGMKNMRERIQAAGGRIDCTSQLGDGTRISFHLPLPAR